MGITIFNPSFPPFICTNTSTWSVSVVNPRSDFTSGDSMPRALTGIPCIMAAAGTLNRKKFLLFMGWVLTELVFRQVHEIFIEVSQPYINNLVGLRIGIGDITVPGIGPVVVFRLTREQ